jgi:hypothetical protein
MAEAISLLFPIRRDTELHGQGLLLLTLGNHNLLTLNSDIAEFSKSSQL